MFGHIQLEKKTVAAMIRIYCDHHHGGSQLCDECAALQRYAHARLDNCRFRDNKPTCFNCAVHCYSRDMGGRIRQVMRYAGPHMMLRHPILAIAHLLVGRRDRRNPNAIPRCKPGEAAAPRS